MIMMISSNCVVVVAGIVNVSLTCCPGGGGVISLLPVLSVLVFDLGSPQGGGVDIVPAQTTAVTPGTRTRPSTSRGWSADRRPRLLERFAPGYS